MLQVQGISGKGRGIVTTETLQPGVTLEIAPVSIIPTEQLPLLQNTEIFKYYFVDAAKSAIPGACEGYLVFGLASLCNHSDRPNARVTWVENDLGIWCHLITQELIPAGEEVSLMYANIEEYGRKDEFVQ